MTDLSTLAALVADRRATIQAEEQAKRDRFAGLAALRPSIDVLERDVMPALDQAQRTLAAVGIKLTVERQWAPDMQGKRAAVILGARTRGDWSANIETLRGDHVEVQHDHHGLRVAVRRQIENGFASDPIECEAGQEVDAAVDRVVMSLLDRTAAGPRMQGSVSHSLPH